MSIVFKENLITGIKEIDDQHKELFNNIDILFDKCQQGKCHEEIEKIMHYLNYYLEEHFKTEETYMKKFNYPDYASHVADHQQFIMIYQTIKKYNEEHGITSFLIIQINKLLKNWLLTHLKNEDKKLAVFLKEKT